MLKYEFNKIIRSKIPSRMIAEGVKVNSKKLNSNEFIDKLKLKLIEEAKEVSSATSRDKIKEELADVMEVMQALAQAADINMTDIEQEQILKREINGHFSPENYINYIEVSEDNEEVIKYLNNKDRPYKFEKIS